jgi:hypothetical protein
MLWSSPSGPASWTAAIGFSLLGLMVSNVFPSFPFTHLPSMYKPRGCSYVMLGVSIFWVKDMFVIGSGSIDWARLRIVSIKEGEIEIQEGFVESRGEGSLSLFAISSAGKRA